MEQLSIIITNAHKKNGHGGRFVCPISRTSGNLAVVAIIFVNDTNLIHIRMDKDKSASEAHETAQEGFIN